MAQTKKRSLKEAVLSTVIGFLVTLIFSYPIYWLWNVNIHLGANIGCAISFTILSIMRGYLIRRWFNRDDDVVNEVEEEQKIFKISV